MVGYLRDQEMVVRIHLNIPMVNNLFAPKVIRFGPIVDGYLDNLVRLQVEVLDGNIWNYEIRLR